jgi:hypothetical protein
MQLANLLPLNGDPEVMLGFLFESFGFIQGKESGLTAVKH